MIEFRPFKQLDYKVAWDMQKSAVKALKEGVSGNHEAAQQLILCEHPHTYTFGKSADRNHLLVNDAFLENIGASRFDIERGGDITYHGPGQLVGYPILDLRKLGIGVKEYVFRLEQSLIDLLAHYGIACYRIDKQIGLWVDQDNGIPKKIAAIGIKVSQGISMHGFALNVNTDLSYFEHIVPCGIPDKGVTSMALELSSGQNLESVAEDYQSFFRKQFSV